MKIEEIKEFVEKNSDLGLDLEKAARNVPQLQARALQIRAEETAELKKLELQMDMLRRKRWMFYSGKGDAEDYKDQKFDIKVLRGDMNLFIDGDKDVVMLKSKIENQKIKIALIDDYAKSLNQRTFLIRSIIDVQKLQQGLL